jgi:hypothetical protein
VTALSAERACRIAVAKLAGDDSTRAFHASLDLCSWLRERSPEAFEALHSVIGAAVLGRALAWPD